MFPIDMFLIKNRVVLDVSSLVVKAMVIVWVWSLGMVLYFETLRMSENLLDLPLIRRRIVSVMSNYWLIY